MVGGELRLAAWGEQWLRTKGPNKITYEYTHEDGVISSFKLRQGFCMYGDEVHRKQRVNIGFFYENESGDAGPGKFEENTVTI